MNGPEEKEFKVGGPGKKEFKANGPVQIKINKNLGDDFDFTSCISTAKIPADQTST